MGKSAKYHWRHAALPCLVCLLAGCGLPHGSCTRSGSDPPEPAQTGGRAERSDPPVASEWALRELETAYSLRSDRLVEAFLEKWHRSYPTDDPAAISNDTLRTVYEIFDAVYKPDPARRPTGRRADTLYRYTIIQNRIGYEVIGDKTFDRYYSGKRRHARSDFSEPVRNKRCVIENFRPRIRIPNLKSLYLTDEYKTILDEFMGDLNLNSAAGEVVNPDRPENSWEKWAFLQEYLYVLYRHWLDDWQYGLPPTFEYLILNESLDKAVVDLRDDYSGYALLLRKKGSEWQPIRKIYDWIE